MLTVSLLLCGLFCFQGGFGGDRGGRGGARGGFTPNKARGGMVRTQQTERAGDCDWHRALVGLFDWCCLLHAHDLPVVLVLFFSLCAGRLRRKEGVVRLNSTPLLLFFFLLLFFLASRLILLIVLSPLFERLGRCVFLSQTTTPSSQRQARPRRHRCSSRPRSFPSNSSPLISI